MSKDNIRARIKTLKCVESITNIIRLKSITKIASLNKNFQRKLSDALSIKQLLSHYDKDLNVGSKLFSHKVKSKTTEKILYIYITDKTKIKSLSCERLNNQLLEKFDRYNDYLITIGTDAHQFCIKNNISALFSLDNKVEKETIFNLQASIYELYMLEDISKVKFVFYSNRLIKNSVTILPIDNFKINIENEDKEFFKHLDHLKIYPSVENLLVELPKYYINFICHALIKESYFHSLKQNLLREKALIDSIQEKIEELENEIIKQKREKITEEITFSNEVNKK